MHEDFAETANSIKEALRYLLADAESIGVGLVSLHIRLAMAEASTFIDLARKRGSSTAK